MQWPSEGLRIVECRIDGDPIPIRVRREDFHDLQRIAVLKHRMRHRPPYDIGCPGDEGITVPESDGLAIPLRNLLHVLPADEDPAEKVVSDTAQELDLIWRDHDLDVIESGLRPPSHYSFRIAEGRIPMW